MLGEKWKALTEKQRTPYEAKAAADKKRYEEEKAAYLEQVCRTSLHNLAPMLMSHAGSGRGGRGGVRVEVYSTRSPT